MLFFSLLGGRKIEVCASTPIPKEVLYRRKVLPILLAPNSEPLTTSLSSDQYEIVLLALTCELKDSLIPIPID